MISKVINLIESENLVFGVQGEALQNPFQFFVMGRSNSL